MFVSCKHVGLPFKIVKNISNEWGSNLRHDAKFFLINQSKPWNFSATGLRTLAPSLSLSKNKVSSYNSNAELQTSNLYQRSLKSFSSSSYLFCNSSSNLDRNITKSDEPVDIGEGSWEEVYKGVLTAQFKLLKMFSIGSSLLGLCMQPILYEQIGNANLGLVVAFGSFIGFFTFATPCLIHFVSKKYVTKLEFDSERDVYAATTLSFFLREKKIHFRPDDVIRPEVPGMFTSFIVKNNALFVDPHQFDDVDHYSRIMGYDKPIDFRPDSEKYKDNS